MNPYTGIKGYLEWQPCTIMIMKVLSLSGVVVQITYKVYPQEDRKLRSYQHMTGI